MPISEVVLGSWNEIHSYARPLSLFRGQSGADWDLATSLERCCNRESIEKTDRLRFEKSLRRDFQRVYHQYAQHLPTQNAPLEWTAIMQHHGAPTRALDFSYSIYVAAYFAVEFADADSAVWAVNGPWALNESVSRFAVIGKREAATFQTTAAPEHETMSASLLFESDLLECVIPLRPFRINERLQIQRGTFLIPGSIAPSFMDNLIQLPNYQRPENLVKLVIPKALRADALAQLYSMNISRSSLFPGLDGYAQSLGVFHPTFRAPAWTDIGAGAV